MIKVKVIENFSLGKFKELKNIVRANSRQDLEGRLFVNDTFECDEEMVEYLTKTNAKGKPFVEVVEVIPEKENTEIDLDNLDIDDIDKLEVIKKMEELEDKKTEKPKRKRKSIAKKD